ncbi:uncharacterized protein PFL1_05756 [Pseudozyma flocculosa PF-1]|uniref:Cyclin N-terminal domain-containing protein n=2 Tax=Pseudozyma flocculosa TaxID=84751 RepID=A0A5C3FB26_9BASI|nr:uncharacterized protein PFL1_05756 [Pseudozyma flocculosa PF-1]EPQ26778.1 hypothetical protein PFL1_05756 [Pseudozyma flocculosa PF-1]SPO40895.1 uncharacterized protein PSFLO_06377 [Pseudozyma flocculosa]
MAPVATSTSYQPQASSKADAQASSSSSSSSSSRRSQRSDNSDPYFGHRDMAILCEKVIKTLFACPLDATGPGVSALTSSGKPTPRLAEFIAYALYRTRLPVFVTHQALYLLKRLKSRFPAARGSSGHRLFISALMLASKSSCDDTYSNKSWVIVGQGLFSLREINQMERELFGYLGYKVNVEPELLDAFVHDLDLGRVVTAPEGSQLSSPLPTPPPSASEDAFATAAAAAVAAGTTNVASAPAPVGFDSPLSDSMAGPHRSNSAASMRRTHPSAAATAGFNTRASFSGYLPQAATAGPSAAAAAYAGVSASAPSSVSMAKSASFRHDRQHSGHLNGAGAQQPFVAHPRDRCRPYTMPTHSMPLSAAQVPQHDRYYANSPAASSVASSSMSSFAGSCPEWSVSRMTPSPTASRRSTASGGRLTPDTPPSDINDDSPWQEAYSPCSDPHCASPKSSAAHHGYVAGAGVAGYHLHPQAKQAAYAASISHPQPQEGVAVAGSIDSHLHPYNCWRA